MKKNILFLCTGNSCRSQMAEGWGRHFYPEKYNFYSAGIKKHGLNPLAVKVMKEAGVDISNHQSSTTDEFDGITMDYVITVCSHANENCPYFPGGKIVHVGFDDPPTLSKDLDSEQDILNIYRRVRDEIKVFASKIEVHLE